MPTIYKPKGKKTSVNSYMEEERKKIYRSERWKRLRALKFANNPLCELCQQDGRLTPAEEVHHKVPLSEGGTHARDNLVALCKSCHARIHAQRGDRWHTQKG